MSLRGWIGTPVVVLPMQLLVQPLGPVPLEAQQLASAEAAAPPPRCGPFVTYNRSARSSVMPIGCLSPVRGPAIVRLGGA